MASRQITLVQSLFSGIEDVSVSSLSWKAVPLEMFFSGFLHQPCFLSPVCCNVSAPFPLDPPVSAGTGVLQEHSLEGKEWKLRSQRLWKA